jgi:hypothetical protein
MYLISKPNIVLCIHAHVMTALLLVCPHSIKFIISFLEHQSLLAKLVGLDDVVANNQAFQ